MNNEIKEILYLEKYIDKYKSDEKSIINGNRLTTPAMLDYLEVKELLDYITNLQRENERLKERVQIGQNAFLSLNNRIDKAIEYLEKAQEGLEEWHYDGYDPNLLEVINILKGEINE